MNERLRSLARAARREADEQERQYRATEKERFFFQTMDTIAAQRRQREAEEGRRRMEFEEHNQPPLVPLVRSNEDAERRRQREERVWRARWETEQEERREWERRELQRRQEEHRVAAEDMLQIEHIREAASREHDAQERARAAVASALMTDWQRHMQENQEQERRRETDRRTAEEKLRAEAARRAREEQLAREAVERDNQWRRRLEEEAARRRFEEQMRQQ